MGRSFSMAAYRALSRRSAARSFTPAEPRPRGELVWLHAAEAGNLLAILDLAHRLCTARDDLHVLVTVPEEHSLAQAGSAVHRADLVHLEQVPSEHPSAVEIFLQHWAPDMCIWTWGDLRPTLISEARARACAMVLIDADTGGFDGRQDRWLPDLTRELLSGFVALMARSYPAASRLEQLGLGRSDIDVTPGLQAGGQALLCDDADLTDMITTLGGRPVWLATAVRKEETAVIFAAHRHAVRYSHRLLLILQPADPDEVDNITETATLEGFRVSAWSTPGEPGETTQVMVAEDAEDLGLFYRLAPVSFLGSSLTPGHGGRDPFEAAALGSAVLYGPNVRRYMPFYTRLANAGAARIVKDAHTLGAAVTRLIAPDQAAAMAHAGWDVVSQGAELTDRVIDLVQDTLDTRQEQQNAHA